MNNNLHSFLRFCSPTLNWIQLECQSPYSAYAWKDFKLLNSDMGHDCRASKLTRERPHLCALDFELKFHYRIYFIWNQHTSSSSSSPTVITRYQMMMLYFLSIVWPCVAGIASRLLAYFQRFIDSSCVTENGCVDVRSIGARLRPLAADLRHRLSFSQGGSRRLSVDLLCSSFWTHGYHSMDIRIGVLVLENAMVYLGGRVWNSHLRFRSISLPKITSTFQSQQPLAHIVYYHWILVRLRHSIDRLTLYSRK